MLFYFVGCCSFSFFFFVSMRASLSVWVCGAGWFKLFQSKSLKFNMNPRLTLGGLNMLTSSCEVVFSESEGQFWGEKTSSAGQTTNRSFTQFSFLRGETTKACRPSPFPHDLSQNVWLRSGWSFGSTVVPLKESGTVKKMRKEKQPEWTQESKCSFNLIPDDLRGSAHSEQKERIHGAERAGF